MTAEEKKEKRRQLYREWRDQGLCGNCGKRWAEAGRSKCRQCRSIFERSANRPEAKEALREHVRSIRQYRRENGLCFNCGKPLTEREKGINTQCARCRGMARERQQVQRIRNRIHAQRQGVT